MSASMKQSNETRLARSGTCVSNHTKIFGRRRAGRGARLPLNWPGDASVTPASVWLGLEWTATETGGS